MTSEKMTSLNDREKNRWEATNLETIHKINSIIDSLNAIKDRMKLDNEVINGKKNDETFLESRREAILIQAAIKGIDANVFAILSNIR